MNDVTEFKSALARRIAQRAKAKDISIRALGLRVGSEALVQNIMVGKSKSPRAENLRGIALALDTTTDWLLNEIGPEVVTRNDDNDEAPMFSIRRQTPPTAAGELVEVRGTAAGSHDRGSFQFNGETIDYIERPAALRGLRNVFAFYVEGDSMEPEHRQGDLRFATSDRPPRPGDTVVIEALDDPDYPEPWAMIGHLERRAGEVVIGKLNPKKQIKIPALAVKAMHKVLSTNEVFGK